MGKMEEVGRVALMVCLSLFLLSLPYGSVDELSKKRQVYDSNQLIAAKTKGVRYSPFLYQIPCRYSASNNQYVYTINVCM